ncbi:oligosaccharide flippase family protein [Agathobaculum desmolans]|uniref:oligosaccharide flippase family protein n=1 Tax=Agathobaculum desmolans TaxID=39484 RepID=UPI00248DAB8B|nr:oligosaccharide flippase family protein [Agathobaculum desmolans]
MRIKRKTVAYAAGVLACGNLALQALGFVYRIILSRYAGAEGLGVYRLVNSAYLVLHAGCLSGVTMACSRLSAVYEARGEHQRVGAVLRLAFSIFLTLCISCAAAVLLFGDEIAAGLLGDARCARAFPFMVLCLLLTGVENIFKALFIGLEQMQYTAYSEVGEQLVRIFSVGWLLRHDQSGDYGVTAMLIFAGMVISEIFSALFLTGLFRRSTRHHPFGGRVDTVTVRRFLGIAVPLSAASLIGNAIGSAGAVLLPQRLMAAGMRYDQALAALGVISGMAMPLLLLPSALVSSVCTALLPAVTAAQATGQQTRVRALVGRAVMTVGLIGLPATAVLIPLAPSLCMLFFSQPLTQEYVFLLGAAVAVCYYQMLSNGLLNALGLQKWSVVTGTGAELLQLALLYDWCARPMWGIYGYLLAMLLTGAAAFAVDLCILYRHTGFSLHPLRRFGVPVVCAITLYAWTRWFYTILLYRWGSAPGAAFGALCGAVGIYVLVLRLFGIRLVRYLTRRMESHSKPRLCIW